MTRKEKLHAQFELTRAIRHFFDARGFIDVLTPPMVLNPGMETHIHPFQVARALTKTFTPWYLNTSPEFHMKELLSMGFENIFSINYSFRDEPNATNHRPQFLMLEWYRTQAHYTKIMEDCELLIRFCLNNFVEKKLSVDHNLINAPMVRMTIQTLFSEYLKINILDFLETKDLKELIEKDFKDVPLPARGEILSWDDYYFLLFLNKIEPHLAHIPFLLLYEFPHHLSALSTLKVDDPRVCERFEIYAKGVELCNCFNELTDLKIQTTRFALQAAEKKLLYNYELPEPTILYNSLSNGLPTSAGIAMGIERLLKVLTGIDNPFWD